MNLSSVKHRTPQRRQVAVTGGAGFIGSHLADALLARGDDVRVIDDLSTGTLANLAEQGDRIEFRKHSILDRPALAESLEGCDVVFHLAAYVSAPGSMHEVHRCHEINETGTLNVLEASRGAGVRRVLMASSSAVYGSEGVGAAREGDRIAPESPYGMSKAVGELMLQTWARCFGMETVALRLFNVFGPRQSASSAYAAVIAAFMSRLHDGKSVTIYGTGEQTRDFVFVQDVAEAFVRASVMDCSAPGLTMNVGTGRSISVLELAHLIAELFDRVDAPIQFADARPGDVLHSCASISELTSQLNWQPTTSIREGLSATAEWFSRERLESRRCVGH